ncbi:flavodoxin domain-containing protein [Cellulomonas sp. ATA003]|uniref:flavodoxin domain-containing protein n=1 Tax=Cellulomonas sp. ATA003 TaxID=3073064 RepID=UPI002872B33C|nr:flavodoxin domain-containing protein [Cellulomonas sp. ATA003]WNB84486.1 flavodoxin domain-containing protein [Cellulomonas sp. ATA003]
MRILVTVGSRHGATREIGDEIAQVLARDGHTVDVLHPDAVDDVSGYGAVVVGSAVYAGRLLPSVRGLVRRCAAPLRAVPVWVFWSGPVGQPSLPDEAPGEVEVLLRDVAARGHTVFAGRLDRADLGLAERAVVRMLGVADGDHRDFAAVDRWASGIAGDLAGRGPSWARTVRCPRSPPTAPARGRRGGASRCRSGDVDGAVPSGDGRCVRRRGGARRGAARAR